jgi:DNA modification methylase
MGSEFIWEGKYDEYGRRRGIVLPESPIPIRRIEAIDAPSPAEFRNRLFFGDNKLAMAHLLDEFRGKVSLIYIDPPFDVGGNFKMPVEIGVIGAIRNGDSPIETVAYEDSWGHGGESYMAMMYERLLLCRELLSDKGTIYVHCDWRKNAHLRLLLEEVFEGGFLNNIVWAYKTGGIPEKVGFSKKHDDILVYTKSSEPIFNLLEQKSYVPTLPDPHMPSGKRLGVMRDEVCPLCENGRPGQKYRMVRARDVWDDVASIFRNDNQGSGYPTQKPEALLERIILASSNEGDLVADLFCGSGSSLVAAEKLGRRWIGADLGRRAIHAARKRLLETRQELLESGERCWPFDIYEVGEQEKSPSELPSVEFRAVQTSEGVDIELTAFTPRIAGVSKRAALSITERAATARFDFLDFWAVDFEYDENKPFVHHWQEFRSRKNRNLKMRSNACWIYKNDENRRIAVKAIDVFGVETIQVIDAPVSKKQQ